MAKNNTKKFSPIQQPDKDKSLYKVKVYFSDGGETTIFSYDFEHERLSWINQLENCYQLAQNQGLPFHRSFNGFRKLEEFAQKLISQDAAKVCIIYCQPLKVQQSDGVHRPAEIARYSLT